MTSWWNSAELVSIASNIARWLGACIAIIILVLGHRLSTLQALSKKEEKQKTQAAIDEARELASKLEERQKPRQISSEQRVAFLAHVAKTPKGKVSFKCAGNSKETSDFCADLRSLFTAAGFDVAENVPMFISSGFRATGVSMGIRNADRQPAHGGDIQKALVAIGIPMPAAIDADDASLSEDVVLIYVGGKF